MIRTFRHKGIAPHHAAKLGRLLDRLDTSTSPQDMNLPGFDLHPLKGNPEEEWSVSRLMTQSMSTPRIITDFSL
jgi:plasmid maintenance system killer protein